MKTTVGIVLLFLVMTLFPSVPARAVEIKIAPEFNPICWQKEACNDARVEFSGGSDESGWLGGEAPCDAEGWGKCLPVGQTTTTIAFGGQRRFKDIGEFVTTLYNYGVRIAGLLAALVIIVAGFQWVVSGGNSETISSAKKRIGGAIIGLMIAFSSYVILNTINPNLVQFRLPQIWLVRSSKLMPEFCRQSPSSTDFAFLGVNGQTISSAQINSKYGSVTTTSFGTMKCGDQYVAKDGAGNICRGDVCPSKDEVCAPYIYSNDTFGTGYSCVHGQMTIRFDLAAFFNNIRQGSFSFGTTEGGGITDFSGWLDYDNTGVYGVCKSYKDNTLVIGDFSSWGSGRAYLKVQADKRVKPWRYTMILGGLTGDKRSRSDWGCPDSYGVVGFIVRTEVLRSWSMDEPFLYIGQTETGGVVFGSWKTVGIENYIRKDKIGSSMAMFSVSLDDADITDIFDNGDRTPHGNETFFNAVTF